MSQRGNTNLLTNKKLYDDYISTANATTCVTGSPSNKNIAHDNQTTTYDQCVANVTVD